MQRILLIFISLFTISFLFTWNLILSLFLAAIGTAIDQILFAKPTVPPPTPWYPPSNTRLGHCHICGKHNILLIHACHVWVERDGHMGHFNTASLPLHARLLNHNHQKVWSCKHQHRDEQTRRQCAYQHLIKHQEGTCTCWNQPRQTLSPNATVYLIYNTNLNAVKVGISGESRYRIRNHINHGWELYHETPLLPRYHALEAERYILAQWRTIQQLPYGVPAQRMPQKGYTETAPLDQVNLTYTRQLLNEYLNI